MVKQNSRFWIESLNTLIINFVKENLTQFSLKSVTNYGPYWGVSFIDNSSYIEFRVRGENEEFDIVIIINNEEFPLWKYDRSVNNSTYVIEKNMYYQLSVLKSFFSEKE